MEANHKKNWERGVLEDLMREAIIEKKRSRRWGFFMKSAFLLYLVVLMVLIFPEEFFDVPLATGVHTAMVELDGVIASGELASADNVIAGLRDAFEDKKTLGVVLRINSPGGSPVQSSNINKEIIRLKGLYPDIPFYAVVSDIAASGGYYVAAAADRIYVNESSVVGSIGVRLDSFGFVEAIDKLGIKRRLMTAGEHKGILDPFLPVEKHDVKHMQKVLDQLHKEFIATVKKGRGKRLKIDDKTFSGLFWTGTEGIKMGLVDAIGSTSYVAREVIGAEEIVDFTHREHVLDRLFARLGAGAAATVAKISGLSSEPQYQ